MRDKKLYTIYSNNPKQIFKGKIRPELTTSPLTIIVYL